MKRTISAVFALIAALGFTIGATAAYGEPGGHEPRTFCHNGHTITTDNQGLINGHMRHVASGKDSLGPCPVDPTPEPSETPEPTPTPEPVLVKVCDQESGKVISVPEEEAGQYAPAGSSWCEPGDYTAPPPDPEPEAPARPAAPAVATPTFTG